MSYLLWNVKPGDEITVIRSFCASPLDSNLDGSETFNVGDKVWFLNYCQFPTIEPRQPTEPTWLVTFERDGIQYEAADDLFTTEKNLGELKDALLRVYIEEEAKKLKLKGPSADYKWWMDWMKLVWYFCMIFLFFWLLAALFAK